MITNSVLLIDDDCDTLIAIGERCRDIGLRVRTAHNLLAAINLIERQPPDLVCIDPHMPFGNGLRFCEMLTTNSDTEHVPIIVLTGMHDAATVEACKRIDAHYLLKRPDIWPDLGPLIERLLESRRSTVPLSPLSALSPQPRETEVDDDLAPPEPRQAAALACGPGPSSGTVVIAAGERCIADELTEGFTRLGCLVIGVDDLREVGDVVEGVQPDVVCIDVDLPEGEGLSACQMMVYDKRLHRAPIIALMERMDADMIRRWHDLMVYPVQKGCDLWSRVEPLLNQLMHWCPQERRLTGTRQADVASTGEPAPVTP